MADQLFLFAVLLHFKDKTPINHEIRVAYEATEEDLLNRSKLDHPDVESLEILEYRIL